MITLRQAAQQALEALERTVDCGHDAHECANVRAMTALRAALVEEALQSLTDVSQEIEAALAEPEQYPVAWLFTNLQSGDYDFCYQEDEHDHDREMWHKQPLYTAPPQRKPLTKEEIRAIRDTYYRQMGPIEFARAIEHAHGIGEKT